MLSNTILGCIVFFITNISLLYAAHLFVRRFFPQSPPSVRLTGIFLLFYSFIILIFQALSPFHAITKVWVSFLCILLALIFHFAWGKQRNFKADFEPVVLWIREILDSRGAALLVVCGFVVLFSLSRALLMPPLAWDSLTYNLTLPALWIKKGTLLLFKAPHEMIFGAHFPINANIFSSWLILPFHNDLLVNLMNFPITLLGGISCYAIARELGLTRKEAGWAPALVCFSPVIYNQITTGYADNAVFAFVATSVLFTLRYLKKGFLHDGLLAYVAAGILFGIKYTALPGVLVLLVANTTKTISQVRYPGFFKKSGLILLGFLVLFTFGGRKYMHNLIEAGNPIFPFPVKIFNHELFEGWGKIGEFKKNIADFANKVELDKQNFWEKHIKMFYYGAPTSAGPKFFLFFVLALISFFIRNHNVPKRCWYFLSLMWIVPLVFYYSRMVEGGGVAWAPSTRYIFSYFAIFTIQGLLIIKKSEKYFSKINFFLVIFIAWDLLHVNKTHLWLIEVLYPYLFLLIPLVLILLIIMNVGLKRLAENYENLLGSSGVSGLSGPGIKRWLAGAMGFVFLVGMLYFLQNYRDITRYRYYLYHTDLHNIPRIYVNGWEFLDQPDNKKTIALTTNCLPAEHKWFFYPLLGKQLQNDIFYISPKRKGEVPTWFDRGVLKGNDFPIWVNNLKIKKVDYIFAQKPWPIELKWMKENKDIFRLSYSGENVKIYRYTGVGT